MCISKLCLECCNAEHCQAEKDGIQRVCVKHGNSTVQHQVTLPGTQVMTAPIASAATQPNDPSRKNVYKVPIGLLWQQAHQFAMQKQDIAQDVKSTA